MNKALRDMLTGVILGDAHIKKVGLDKAFISFEQSSKKIEYLNYLHNIIKEAGYVTKSPTVYTRNDSRYNNTTESLYFRTESIPELRPLADSFLDEEGKKIIPSNIGELLSPRGLAFWIMDDGQQVKRGGVTLCTDSFSSSEVNVLRDILREKFQITTSIHKKKIGEDIRDRIYINKSSLEEVKPLLQEHMHDSMLYKIHETANNAEQDRLNDLIDIISDVGSDIGDF